MALGQFGGVASFSLEPMRFAPSLFVETFDVLCSALTAFRLEDFWKDVFQVWEFCLSFINVLKRRLLLLDVREKGSQGEAFVGLLALAPV